MVKIALLGTVLVILHLEIRAQTVRGQLLDASDNRPLRSASLNLTSLKDSTRTFYTTSDNNGNFQLDNLYQDSFTLKISFIGYADFRQIIVLRDTLLDLGTLLIPKSVKQLREVTVVAKEPPVEQKGDTLQYNASQFKVNSDATAEDMVKKLPGVTVDKQGTVTAGGEQVKKVTIDGREFFGDDATAALRNLPAEIIDKIQVFD